jgi:hypothetical protein
MGRTQMEAERVTDMVSLNPTACRKLTDREASRLLGGLIGALVGTAGAENTLRAVQWWAERPEIIRNMRGQLDDLAKAVAGAVDREMSG